jgi:hypothetical protein
MSLLPKYLNNMHEALNSLTVLLKNGFSCTVFYKLPGMAEIPLKGLTKISQFYSVM